MKVLITGATGGLGRELASQYAMAGHDLCLVARDKYKLNDINSKLSSQCKISIMTIAANLQDPEELNKVVSQASSWDDGIDILINCAALFNVESITEVGIDDFDSCFNLNVRAPYFLSISLQKKGNLKQIINIGSSSAYAGFKDTTLYCASKHALLGLSRSLFEEYRDTGTRVFFIAPGSIQTPMGEKVPNQDYSTFIDPKELAEYIYSTTNRDSNMIIQEVRVNRYNVQ